MDRICLRDLEVRAIIGAHERERRQPQVLLVGIELEADLGPAAAADDLAFAIDYAALAERVAAHAEASRFHLLEALAASIADLALEHFPAIAAITVAVDQPAALARAGSVGVTIRRERGDATSQNTAALDPS